MAIHYSKNSVDLKQVDGKIDSGSNQIPQFRKLCDLLAELGAGSGYSIVPYRDPLLIHFRKLTDRTQADIINSLNDYIRICQMTLNSGYSLRNSRQVTWNALKTFNLTPMSDLFEHVTDDQVIEFYNSDNIQIFRNFSFFELCSYTLEDVYCRPWYELFHRDETVTTAILAEFNEIFSGRRSKTLISKTPRHHLKEIDSRGEHLVEMQVEFCSPLACPNSSNRHLVVAESCRLVSSRFEALSRAPINQPEETL